MGIQAYKLIVGCFLKLFRKLHIQVSFLIKLGKNMKMYIGGQDGKSGGRYYIPAYSA